jgi:hypothetical protein
MARISATRSGGSSVYTKGSKGDKIKSNKSEKNTKASLRANVDINHSPFLDKLLGVEMEFVKEELEGVLAEIETLGKELLNNPTMAGLKLYKAKIQNFLKQAMKKIYKVDNKLGLKKLGEDQKVYVSVDKIDEELEKLTMKFLEEQTDSLDLVATVEGIKGLLCNVII